MQLRSVSVPPGWARPNYESLVRHFDKYGLSNAHTGHRGSAQTYGNYKKFAKDALAEVAFDYLGEDTYVVLVERIGYSEFADQAREDWRQARGL